MWVVQNQFGGNVGTKNTEFLSDADIVDLRVSVNGYKALREIHRIVWVEDDER